MILFMFVCGGWLLRWKMCQGQKSLGCEVCWIRGVMIFGRGWLRFLFLRRRIRRGVMLGRLVILDQSFWLLCDFFLFQLILMMVMMLMFYLFSINYCYLDYILGFFGMIQECCCFYFLGSYYLYWVFQECFLLSGGQELEDQFSVGISCGRIQSCGILMEMCWCFLGLRVNFCG